MSTKRLKWRSRAGLVVLASLAVIGAALGWFAGREGSAAPEVRNILLISIDTCRPDYFSCYGYKDKTTPHIDRLAAEGVLFQNVLSPVPMTLPAHKR